MTKVPEDCLLFMRIMRQISKAFYSLHHDILVEFSLYVISERVSSWNLEQLDKQQISSKPIGDLNGI